MLITPTKNKVKTDIFNLSVVFIGFLFKLALFTAAQAA